MTAAERKLWWHLRHLPLADSHFRRQATIGRYFTDFACHELRLVIEIDGGQHSEAKQLLSDATRTAFLESREYQVLRFWNNDVMNNIEGVLSSVQDALSAARACPPPPTPPRRSTSLRGGRGPAPQHYNVETKPKSTTYTCETKQS